jgi:hypothetical protein
MHWQQAMELANTFFKPVATPRPVENAAKQLQKTILRMLA